MRVIELGERDVAEAAAIKKEAFNRPFDIPPLPEESVRRALRRGTRRALGIRENGRLLSVLYVTRRNARAWFIPSLATRPEARRRGLADTLLKRAIALARENNATSLSAVVSPQNKASLALLEKNGFAKKRFLPKYFGPGKDRYLMRLGLRR
ncbi:MAG: GNAT family N-acetyltransferase [Candidatus Micrarchaeota archaeon]